MLNKNVRKRTLAFILALSVIGSIPFSLDAAPAPPPPPPMNDSAADNSSTGVSVNGQEIAEGADIVWFNQIWQFSVNPLKKDQYTISQDGRDIEKNIAPYDFSNGQYEVCIYGNGNDKYYYSFGFDNEKPSLSAIYNSQNSTIKFNSSDMYSGIDKYCINGSDNYVDADQYGVAYDVQDAGAVAVKDKAGNYSDFITPETYTLSIDSGSYVFNETKPSDKAVTLVPMLSTTPSCDYKFQYSSDGGNTWAEAEGDKLVIDNTDGAEEYIFRAVCTDGSDFEICRNSAKVNADTTLPDKAVVFPKGEWDKNHHYYITVPEISITAPARDTTTYIWDNTEYTIPAGQTIIVPKDKITEGSHKLTVSVTDSAGNSVTENYDINVNAVKPEISEITANMSHFSADSSSKTIYCSGTLSITAAVNDETSKIVPVCDGTEMDSSLYTINGNTVSFNEDAAVNGRIGIKAFDKQDSEIIFYIGEIKNQNEGSFTAAAETSAENAYKLVFENTVLSKPEIKVSYNNGNTIAFNKDSENFQTPWINSSFDVSFSKTDEREFSYQYKKSDADDSQWTDCDGSISVSENGKYDFRSVSRAGIYSEILTVDFRIHKTAPSEASLTVSGGSSSQTGWYGDIQLELRNNNLKNDSVPLAVTHCDIYRTDTDGTNKVGYLKISSDGTFEDYNIANGVSVSNDGRLADISLSQTGIYEFRYWTSDEAGNTTSTASSSFKMQTEKPVIYSLDFAGRNILTSKSLFFVSADLAQLSVDADFGFSGPAEQDSVIYEYKSALSDEWKVCGNINLFRNDRYNIRVTIKNKAGMTAQSNNSTIVVDSRMPVGENNAPEITMKNSGTVQNNIYSSDVNIDITAIDPKENNVCSGLNRVSYRVENNETNEVVSSGDLFNFDITSYKSLDDVTQTYKGSITVPASVNSNDITVYVEAEDNAGNIKLSSQNIKIDSEAPQLNISFDNNKMTNGIFSASRTATITVDEKNFDSADMIIKAVNSDGSAPQISGWSSYGNIHTATVSFNDDGIYTFSAEYTDMAGNKGNVTYSGEQPNSFTIDKTAPVVTVEYDNNDSENESYYNKPRTATITVNDKNISNEMLSEGVIIDGKAAGKNISWSSAGENTVSCKVPFTEDGVHSLKVSVSDLAGNVSASAVNDTFTIDTTAPVLTISGVDNNSANKGSVVPVIEYSDTNLDSSKIEINLLRDNKKASVKEDRTSKGDSGKVVINNFKDDKSETDDGYYILNVSITDMAGIVTSEQIEFSINRTGPVYRIDEAPDGYNQTASNLKVTVIDVDPVISTDIDIVKDGIPSASLEKGVNYSVTENKPTEDSNRYEYQYLINSSNFEQNGSYNVIITTKDNADNSSDNTIAKLSLSDEKLNEKSTEIRFTIDNIPPTAIFDDIVSNGRYNTDNKTVSFIVRDNISIASLAEKSVEIFINGTELALNADNYNAEDGRYTFNIPSSDKLQTVLVKCTDRAGNSSEYNFENILITSDKFKLYQKQIIAAAIAAAAVIACSAVLFAGVKSKKKKKN